jgi:hypothetical protein
MAQRQNRPNCGRFSPALTNENEYAVASFEQKLAAVRKLESVVIQ